LREFSRILVLGLLLLTRIAAAALSSALMVLIRMEIRELIHFILGSLVATGSSDTSIKLIDVEKMKTFSQTKDQGNDEFSAARPVTRTFYDHTQVPFLFITPKNSAMARCLPLFCNSHCRLSTIWLFIRIRLSWCHAQRTALSSSMIILRRPQRGHSATFR